MPEYISRATQYIQLPDPFPMRRGGLLRRARIAYETWGLLSPARDNAILILTGLSPSAHAAAHEADPTPGWWECMVGPQRPIDTNHWFVVCVNSLGSCKGSTGPASLNPETGQPYRLEFPALTIEDIADAAAFAVQSLNIERLACVIGASMGGMSALALVAQHPGLARNHIGISSAVHALPFSIALRSLQRQAIQYDPGWHSGQYCEHDYPEQGMAYARKLGMLTYRSALEWKQRFGRSRVARAFEDTTFYGEFEVESYLLENSIRFIRSYDPNCYLYLSRCIDWFDLGESYDGGADDALSRLRLEKALIIGVETDILFPWEQQKQIADGLNTGRVCAQFKLLDSVQGHDAFLMDYGRFGPPITEFLVSLT